MTGRRERALRVLTIGHSYVVALNQAVPAAIARDPRVDLTLAAPRFHYGDLRRINLERIQHPDYDVVPLRAHLTRWNHVFRYESVRLHRLIASGQFDIVHAWEEPYTWAGHQIARACRGTRSRFIFRTAQSLVKRYPWPFRWFERATLARADGWVAGGQLVYDAMVSKGFPAARGRVINLGVDTDIFRPIIGAARREVQAALDLEGPVIGFTGRLVAAKGLDVLTQALRGLTTHWTLLVLGSGPYEGRLRDWSNRHGYGSRVRILLVDHDDMPRYLNAMDVLVAPSQTTPSWKEQFGRMVIEAFSCRVPVVGSDSGEIPNVIADAGLVVGESDVAGWTNALQRLLADTRLRDDLAQRGYARCQARYSVERIAERYIDFYEELMKSPPRTV